jgi:multiple sugar transport system permease protein
VIANIVLAIVAIAFALPLAWLVIASFDPHANLSLKAPSQLSFDNYAAIGTWNVTFRPLVNGLIISGVATLIVVICATLAAYPLSRFQLRHKNSFLYSILFLSSLPVTAIMVPVYTLFVQINLIDNYVGCILFLAASGLPYAIWMTKNFMDGVPIELEEAAWIDGASSMRSLRSVVLPLMAPGLVAVSFFEFILMWGNFFVPFILLLDPQKLPMAVTVYQFFQSNGLVNYGHLAAYAMIYSGPVVLLYVLISRVFSGAFRLSGGTKG